MSPSPTPPLAARAVAAVLYSLSWLAGRLPYPWLRAIGRRVGERSARRCSKDYRVTLRNLELTDQGASAEGRADLAREILANTHATLLETLRVWTRPGADGLALIAEVRGLEHFEAAAANRHGLIVATPHFGNWELLAHYLATRGELAVVYRPPDSAAGDLFIRRMRRFPGVVQTRADAGGVRQMVKRLRAGGRVGILPDQQPKQGEGEFAPFFGVPALTMTLLSRLAARTGATVVLGFTQRRADGRYMVCFEPMPPRATGEGPDALAALNATIEGVARRDPAQYQWTYKRFKFRPHADDPNPYWPDCYGSPPGRG